MFKSSQLKLLFFIFVPSLILIFITSPSKAEAKQQEPDSDNQAFTYQVEHNNNQTLLARKSVQLYAKAYKLELSQAQLIAAESCIVDQLGRNDLIKVDQKITIQSKTVIDAVENAQNLSPAAIKRWQKYQPVRTNLDHIKPSSAPDYVSITELSLASQTQSEQIDSATEVTQQTETSTTDETAPWYWWLIGAISLGAVWYLLGGDPAKTKK